MRAPGGRERPHSRRIAVLLRSPFALSCLLGAAAILGYAPFYAFPLTIIALAGLFALWSRAGSARAAAAAGYGYGLGLFLAGVSWVYVSLHDFGGMPAALAAVATLLFCMFLALLPAAAGYLAFRLTGNGALMAALGAPALWTLAEWIRSWIFTGFPWLAAGYSQIPVSPLAGYAPVLGLHGVTLAAAVSAGLLCWAVTSARGTREAAGVAQRTLTHPAGLALVLVWGTGYGLGQIEWTRPTGDPVTVSLVQGNVPQDLKWRPGRLAATLEAYANLVNDAPGRLIVLPETALPLFLDQAPPDYLDRLAARARANGGDLLVGVPERLPNGSYFNSVISLGSAENQFYRKSHLVPFGEFIPLRPLLGSIVALLAIPLQDFSRGGLDQLPLVVAGQRVAVNICYEDAFGEEIIRQLPAATLLVNVSNVAWFGHSLAPAQHLQISQARALETGRHMLRATNTGMTAVIDPRGRVAAAAPPFTATVVTHAVRGHAGATPYILWGNVPALLLAACLVAAAGMARRRPRGGN